MKNVQARITGTGRFLPEKVLSNEDLEKIVDTNDEWIVSRTGMKERRIALDSEPTSMMGVEAARRALEASGRTAEDIDLIICATCTPDFIFPSTACLIQEALGCKKAAALDIQAACTGYLYALSIVKAMIESGAHKNILIVASEKLSSLVDYEDRATCVLFGDGASAAVVSAEGKGLLLLDSILGSDGSQEAILKVPAGGCRTPASKQSVEEKQHYLQMDGREVYKHAVRRMEAAANQCMEKSGIKEIDWLVPHQANIRIIESLAKRFKLPMEKVFCTIHKYGNTSASSVGIALDELTQETELKTGEHLLLVAFGAGLTWGATTLKVVNE
ncbi:MAG: ketoacyl-ACP synthase III [Simkaniaceae bacterium]|nr:ketoacyl-ACP synthase III [Simkaniaceae bacterium]